MKTPITVLILMIAVALGQACSPNASPSKPAVLPGRETVVLLHGMARSGKAMKKMEKALRTEGYHVINVDYPSSTATIEELAEQIFTALEPQISAAKTVHFVTHSMGGIILRQHLEEHEIPNLGRVVMLAPPSRGSQVPDKLGNIFLYKWINGPAGNQLGTGTDSLPLRLKAPEFELGIIAGDRSINPILSMLIPGPDDGKVALARVKPAAYTDYFQLHATHACMMWNKKVIAQTKHFLEHGKFEEKVPRLRHRSPCSPIPTNSPNDAATPLSKTSEMRISPTPADAKTRTQTTNHQQLMIELG